MIVALISLLWVTDPEVLIAKETGTFSALSLEELCVQHEILSEKLSKDFIKMKIAQLEEQDVAIQIETKAKYNRTVADLKAVTLAMGPRTCPVVEAPEEQAAEAEAEPAEVKKEKTKKEKYDFPPLLESTEENTD